MYFLIGSGIGAAIALLFAPKSGSEFRGDIADLTRKGYDATSEKAIELKEQSENVVQIVKEKAEAAIDLASDKFKAGGLAVSGAVSAVTDEVELIQNDSGVSSKNQGNGQNSSRIL
jgi:gas vesicle protein